MGTTENEQAWSTTAAPNATADAGINWAEGQDPATVNNSARAMMAARRKASLDIGGGLVAGGTATALTVTTNQVLSSAHIANGLRLAVRTGSAATGAATIAFDGLTAVPIVKNDLSAIAADDWPAGALLDLVYSSAANAFIAANLTSQVGSLQIGAPTGGNKGAGTLNLAGPIYINGNQSNMAQIVSKNIPNANVLTTGASPVALFTVTGVVACRVTAVITTKLTSTSNTGTLAIGVSGSTNALLTQRTVGASAFTSGSVWGNIPAPDETKAGMDWGQTSGVFGVGTYVINGSNIIATIATNSLTGGVITFYCEWYPISVGATVVAA